MATKTGNWSADHTVIRVSKTKMGLHNILNHAQLKKIDDKASISDIINCTSDNKYMTPIRTKDAIELHENSSANIRIIKTERFILNSDDITNGYVALTLGTPKLGSVIMSVKNAPSLFYGDDYIIGDIPNKISWSGMDLDGILQVGDKLTISYMQYNAPPFDSWTESMLEYDTQLIQIPNPIQFPTWNQQMRLYNEKLIQTPNPVSFAVWNAQMNTYDENLT